MTPLPGALGGQDLVAWRLDQWKHRETWDSGEGAYLGARAVEWQGLRAVYCAVDPATAILEVAVHKGFKALDTVPHALTSFKIVDPKTVHIVVPGRISDPIWPKPDWPAPGNRTSVTNYSPEASTFSFPASFRDTVEPGLRGTRGKRNLCRAIARTLRAGHPTPPSCDPDSQLIVDITIDIKSRVLSAFEASCAAGRRLTTLKAVSSDGDQVPQRSHALDVEDPPTGERNALVDVAGRAQEVVAVGTGSYLLPPAQIPACGFSARAVLSAFGAKPLDVEVRHRS